MSTPFSIVIGVGPGIGAAVVRALNKKGHHVAALARNKDYLDNLAMEISKEGSRKPVLPCPVDASRPEELKKTLDSLIQDLPSDTHLESLVWNVSYRRPSKFMDLNVKAMETSYRINVIGCFVAIQSVLPTMLKQGKGTIITTGATASMRGTAGFVNFTVGKAGARFMTHALAREFGPSGIHFAHVIIDGPVKSDWMKEMMEKAGETYDPTKCLDPQEIAKNFVHLIEQDKSCWTLELDLRPFTEKF